MDTATDRHADVWHIVRTSDGYYAETVRGTREDAERAAADYRPNPWTERGLAHVVPAEPDYPSVSEYRAGFDAYRARQATQPNAGHDVDGGTCCSFHGVNTREAREGYADYLQRSIAETLARTGRDR